MVDEKVARTFVVVAEPEPVADHYVARFGHIADRVRFYEPHRPSPEQWYRAAGMPARRADAEPLDR